MEIIFDTLGAEQGIDGVIEAGWRLAVQHKINISFVGDEGLIVPRLKSRGVALQSGIRVIHSTSQISMNESAIEAIASKQDASICVTMRQIDRSTRSAVISPGHSGATVLAAKKNWGLLPNITRACLCQILPAENDSHFLLTDVGASVNASPYDLLGYAAMAIATAKTLLNVTEPRIGLLNIGTESSKGDQRLMETHKLLSNIFPEFIGNVEGNQIWKGDCHCVLTDGLTGNILLKSVEGFSSFLVEKARSSLQPKAYGEFEQFIQNILASEYHGAILLGVNGLCIVCHGRASTKDMISAGKLAITCLQNNLIDSLKHFLVRFTPGNNISKA